MTPIPSLAFVSILSIITAGRAVPADQPKFQIAADTNRDGNVVFQDDLDGKSVWTDERGAMFAFNNDSDQNNGKQDCSDRIINGPNDLLDLAPILIRRVSQWPDGGRLYISVSEPARPYVNAFYKNGDAYHVIEDEDKQELPLQLLKDRDIELRIEACSYAFPGWDGKVRITARLETPDGTSMDSVELKVAPFIMLSSSRKAERIYVREFPGKNETFIRALRELTPRLGVQLKIIGPGTYPEWEIWLQDVMEVGFSRTPLGSQHVVLKANRGKSLDDMPEKEILGPDHGWFRIGEFRPEGGGGRGGDSWLDWYGNLEVTPPLPDKPFGRIFYGYNKNTGNSLNPEIVQMLEAQGIQTPLIKIHTGWLLIKHVDEIFNFIPVPGGKGFKALVPDVTVTYKLLDRLKAEGKGDLPLFKGLKPNETLATLAENKELREANLRLQREEIEFSIDGMRTAIGLEESDLIRIPTLFENYRGFSPALMPNMVNAVYMNGHMLMADPRGPLEAGRDLIQEYVRGLLSREGIEVHFLDDLVYHKWGGNVHCATNVTYELNK